MADVTSTSFGLLIAFPLPGFVGLVGVSYWSPNLREILKVFLTAESNVGLFLLVSMVAVAFGLLITVARWLVFERLICHRIRLKPEDFEKLADAAKLAAFRAAVDEHYRYHQFWGGMAVVLPVIFLGWVPCAFGWGPTIIVLAVAETLAFCGAIAAFGNYVQRARKIMK